MTQDRELASNDGKTNVGYQQLQVQYAEESRKIEKDVFFFIYTNFEVFWINLD